MRDRLWQVERTVGAVFIDPGAFHLPHSITRNQCYEICVETGKHANSRSVGIRRENSAREIPSLTQTNRA